MPELPEVQTTVNGINATSKGRTITNVWTSYNSAYHAGKDNIKDPKFFKSFKKKVIGAKIIKAERRAKNILIHLSGNNTILVHMKMTGFFFYNPPTDAKFIRLKFMLDNKKILAFSDMRKFAKVTIIETSKLNESSHLDNIGPEPLEDAFTYSIFKERLLTKPKSKIKPVLMDPSIVAGIGNIYSDEILWRASVHPASIVHKIPEKNLKEMFKATKSTLTKGIDFGGDSMSDYKNIRGEKGNFQDHHQAYMRHKKPCTKRGCSGVLEKTRIGTRSAHFCPVHQTLFK